MLLLLSLNFYQLQKKNPKELKEAVVSFPGLLSLVSVNPTRKKRFPAKGTRQAKSLRIQTRALHASPVTTPPGLFSVAAPRPSLAHEAQPAARQGLPVRRAPRTRPRTCCGEPSCSRGSPRPRPHQACGRELAEPSARPSAGEAGRGAGVAFLKGLRPPGWPEGSGLGTAGALARLRTLRRSPRLRRRFRGRLRRPQGGYRGARGGCPPAPATGPSRPRHFPALPEREPATGTATAPQPAAAEGGPEVRRRHWRPPGRRRRAGPLTGGGRRAGRRVGRAPPRRGRARPLTPPSPRPHGGGARRRSPRRGGLFHSLWGGGGRGGRASPGPGRDRRLPFSGRASLREPTVPSGQPAALTFRRRHRARRRRRERRVGAVGRAPPLLPSHHRARRGCLERPASLVSPSSRRPVSGGGQGPVRRGGPGGPSSGLPRHRGTPGWF